MTTDSTAQAADRRAQVLEAAQWQRRRLRWRHLLPLWTALTAMMFVGMTFVLTPISGPADRDWIERNALWLAVTYAGGAFAVAWAMSRFALTDAVRRFPVILIFGCAAAVLLVITRLGALGAMFGRGKGRHENLASTLVSRDEASALLGASAVDVSVGGFLFRSLSTCRYALPGGDGGLFVTVGEPTRSNEEMEAHLRKHGQPVEGLGVFAVATDSSLHALANGWVLGLVMAVTDAAPSRREELIALGRDAVARLPSLDEVSPRLPDRELSERGLGDYLRGMQRLISGR